MHISLLTKMCMSVTPASFYLGPCHLFLHLSFRIHPRQTYSETRFLGLGKIKIQKLVILINFFLSDPALE